MKQQVFSHSESINYNDYLKMKYGQIVLKSIKQNNNNACINSFLNYQDFLNKTKSYYKYLHPSKCSKHLLTNMFETNKSFINYTALTNKNNYPEKFNTLENIHCKPLLNILYPYGVFDNIKESPFYFPNKLDLKNWCINNKNNCINQDNFIDTFIMNDFPINKTSVNCGIKYNLCNNTKPLFI
jgi:hypothetical protein